MFFYIHKTDNWGIIIIQGHCISCALSFYCLCVLMYHTSGTSLRRTSRHLFIVVNCNNENDHIDMLKYNWKNYFIILINIIIFIFTCLCNCDYWCVNFLSTWFLSQFTLLSYMLLNFEKITYNYKWWDKYLQS